MKIILCITKDDIATRENGNNYEVVLPNEVILNFTKEAIEELYEDMRTIDMSKDPSITPENLNIIRNLHQKYTNRNLAGSSTIIQH